MAAVVQYEGAELVSTDPLSKTVRFHATVRDVLDGVIYTRFYIERVILNADGWAATRDAMLVDIYNAGVTAWAAHNVSRLLNAYTSTISAGLTENF